MKPVLPPAAITENEPVENDLALIGIEDESEEDEEPEQEDNDQEPEKVGSKLLPPPDYGKAYHEIDLLELEVDREKIRWDDLRESASMAKKIYDAAVDRLCRAIRKYRPGNAPLFEQMGVDACESTQIIPEIIPAPAHDAWEHAWKSQPISALTPPLTAAKIKVLTDHEPPIVTMGEMAEFQKSAGDWWVKTLKGFGETGQAQYEAATDAYWKANPEPKAETMELVDTSTEVISVADLGLAAGVVASACHPHLLLKVGSGDIPTLRNVVMLEGVFYAVLPAPVGHNLNVYAMRPLQSEGCGPSADDPYQSLRVQYDLTRFYIGPRSTQILVRDGDDVAAIVDQAEAAIESAGGPVASKSGKKKAKK